MAPKAVKAEVVGFENSSIRTPSPSPKSWSLHRASSIQHPTVSSSLHSSKQAIASNNSLQQSPREHHFKMQFKNALFVLASVMATSAVAVPAPVDATPKVGARTGTECGNNQVISCCNSLGFLNLNICTVLNVIGGILSPACSGNVQCCNTTGAPVGFLPLVLEQPAYPDMPGNPLHHLSSAVCQRLSQHGPPRWNICVSQLIVWMKARTRGVASSVLWLSA